MVKSNQQRHRREWMALALLVPAASCVPEAERLQSPGSLAATSIDVPSPRAAIAAPADAAAFDLPDPAASTVFRSNTSLDRMRALDCLAEAVYYEARSESEDGQRAVAQVVLNRVRHPAYPSSVCGVVYQGPMRPGGGCQFTFTCDGSLARRPTGMEWTRARRIAVEALAGKVFAPVSHSTHYHTFAVAPHWAPALARTTVIGSHIFYRWKGLASAPAAFGQAYSGREPDRAAVIRYTSASTPVVPDPPHEPPAFTTLDPLPVVELASNRLPQSRVRAEYQNSGRWKDAAR